MSYAPINTWQNPTLAFRGPIQTHYRIRINQAENFTFVMQYQKFAKGVVKILPAEFSLADHKFI
jgi:hypothetical protein